jgi:hypothetical protein
MRGNMRWSTQADRMVISSRRARTGGPGPRPRRVAPALESLEGRRLLSFYTGPMSHRPLVTPAGAFLVAVGGPGVVEVSHLAGGAIDLNAYGTTSASTITIIETQPRFHEASQPLLIHNLRIRSGQLGGLVATPAELQGRMTPLTSSVNTLDVGTIGPKAQVDINGSVGSLSIASIDLGPTGRVNIAGDINTITQGGGALLPVTPPTTTTTINTTTGITTITSTGGATTSTTSPTGVMTIGNITINGGHFSIGRDSLESIAINGDVLINRDGTFSIGRDQDGTFTVNGSMVLSSGGQLAIGRNLGNLAITGNLIVQPSGSGVAVGGALSSLTVNGYIQGQGGQSAPSAIDVGVGLNLSGLTVNGGVSGQGGLINTNVRVGGSASGVKVAYGLYNSTIQSNAAMTT